MQNGRNSHYNTRSCGRRRRLHHRDIFMMKQRHQPQVRNAMVLNRNI